jgi:hypothetical protein
MHLTTMTAGTRRSRVAQRACAILLRASWRLKRAWDTYWRERAERRLDAWFVEHRN